MSWTLWTSVKAGEKNKTKQTLSFEKYKIMLLGPLGPLSTDPVSQSLTQSGYQDVKQPLMLLSIQTNWTLLDMTKHDEKSS